MVQILLICFIVSWFVYVTSYGGAMIASGKWAVVNIKKCPNDDRFPMTVDIKRRKINRTHDGFDACMVFEQPVDSTFAVRIDICIYVDGGCKPYQVMADDSFENFINKYALENVQSLLAAARLDPPELPIPVGEYEVNGFIFNYAELPEDGVIGKFGAEAYLLKDQIELCCVDLTMEFKPNDEDDNND